MKTTCLQCGHLNEQEWNFCQVCRRVIKQPAAGRKASSFSFPRVSLRLVGIISITVVLVVLTAVFIGAVLVRSEKDRETALAASFDEQVQAARAKLAEGDIPGAREALGEALRFRSTNAASMRETHPEIAELMVAECNAVLASDSMRYMVGAMSESEFKAFVNDGTLPRWQFYRTPEIDAYARRVLTESKEGAIRVRRGVEIAKRKAEKEAATVRREAREASKQKPARADDPGGTTFFENSGAHRTPTGRLYYVDVEQSGDKTIYTYTGSIDGQVITNKHGRVIYDSRVFDD